MVTLDVDAVLLCESNCVRALHQCSNLRTLSITSSPGEEVLGVTDETIGNVFSQSQFPNLEALSIGDFKANERNMGLIASCTKNLKYSNFNLFELDTDVSGFQLIADSNMQLKEIAISLENFHAEKPSEETALEWLTEVVKIFRKCRSVWVSVMCSNKGVVKKEDLIRACKVMPCRGVDVFIGIGDVRYQYSELTT